MPKKASLTCFFIGPMKTETGELERLKRLGETLLAPTLRPLGYDIVFPDDKRGSADSSTSS